MTGKPVTNISQDEIDLLAEGEITGAARDLLFVKLDQSPEDWRRLALALMESQSLARSIRSINISKVDHQVSVVTKKEAHDSRAPGLVNRLAVWGTAVCLILLIGLGLGIGIDHFRFPKDEEVVDLTAPMDSDNSIVRGLAARDPDLLKMLEHSIHSLGVADSEVIALFGQSVDGQAQIFPIIKSASLERQLSEISTPKLPANIVNQLSSDGWQLNSLRHFVSFQHLDGRQQTLPIGMLSYQRRSRETF